MKVKLSLDINTLSVDSFNTANTPVQPTSPAGDVNLVTCDMTDCGRIRCCR